MSAEAPEPVDGLKLELDDDASSMHTESEDLNSPQVETNTENELSKCTKSKNLCPKNFLLPPIVDSIQAAKLNTLILAAISCPRICLRAICLFKIHSICYLHILPTVHKFLLPCLRYHLKCRHFALLIDSG